MYVRGWVVASWPVVTILLLGACGGPSMGGGAAGVNSKGAASTQVEVPMRPPTNIATSATQATALDQRVPPTAPPAVLANEPAGGPQDVLAAVVSPSATQAGEPQAASPPMTASRLPVLVPSDFDVDVPLPAGVELRSVVRDPAPDGIVTSLTFGGSIDPAVVMKELIVGFGERGWLAGMTSPNTIHGAFSAAASFSNGERQAVVSVEQQPGAQECIIQLVVVGPQR